MFECLGQCLRYVFYEFVGVKDLGLVWIDLVVWIYLGWVLGEGRK